MDTLLSEQQVLEDRKQALIDDLLKQREAAMATFDEQLAKLGYQANSVKPRSSHTKGQPRRRRMARKVNGEGEARR